ncbi:hypothetical protein B7P43_G02974 [Cryptotermes secundus]|uniref:Uncharacterized protein n=1 Tax=Cryptotermes secundus TaxID=105785 RepID=A0A2J7PM55_9NEOP|nr:hypothetical protein B7P43_G02974 [Cryptotermes secundus]
MNRNISLTNSPANLLTNRSTDQPTPKTQALLEKSTAAKPSKKFTAFCGTHRQDSKQIKMISSRETGPGTLTVGVKRNVWVVEIVNDPLLQQVPIKRRGCRFPEEIPDHYKLFKYYSYSTCVLECRAIKMLEHCNCINHIIHPGDLVKLKGKHSESEMESGMTCDCSADCNEPDQFILHEEKKLTKKYSEIKFVMETLPNERLRRNVVRSKLDLVAECECGDGLQTEEHIFWDCKQYKDQRATLADILSENSKKYYPK